MISWGTLSRERLPLSLFIIEIDNFQTFYKTNDISAINSSILNVANALNNILQRQSDFISQANSHRFMFLINEMNFKQARQFSEKCHQTIANLEITYTDSSTSDIVTVSIGHATCTPKSHNCEGPQAFINSAQKYLKKAVKAGGNCSKTSLKF